MSVICLKNLLELKFSVLVCPIWANIIRVNLRWLALALDHRSIELEAIKERNPTIMYTDRERAEKCRRQAQASLFLTFFHSLSCYAIFHIKCHIRWTQPQPLGEH